MSRRVLRQRAGRRSAESERNNTGGDGEHDRHLCSKVDDDQYEWKESTPDFV